MEFLFNVTQTTENTDRMIAAMTTLATMTMLPEGSELLLVAFCKTIEPAEA